MNQNSLTQKQENVAESEFRKSQAFINFFSSLFWRTRMSWTEFIFKLSTYHSFIAKVEKYYEFKLYEIFIAKKWKLMNINDSKW